MLGCQHLNIGKSEASPLGHLQEKWYCRQLKFLSVYSVLSQGEEVRDLPAKVTVSVFLRWLDSEIGKTEASPLGSPL